MSGIDKERLRARREACGLDQQQLAERAGTTQPTVSRIERGESRGTKQLRAFARVLATSEDYLEGIVDDPGPLPATDVDALPVQPTANAMTLEDALGRSFDPTRHQLRDATAVEEALRDTRGLRDRDDILAAARLWLDCAAEMRASGERVDPRSLLVRVTLRSLARATPPSRDLDADGDAELAALGAKPPEKPANIRKRI
jgi:transcriptional regulator with XRE-family HTH domain